MTTYTKLTDFAAKDALVSGNPNKLVKGTELGAEFDSIAAADATNAKTTDLSASTGSSLIGHISTATAAVATTVQAKLRACLNAKEDFGVTGNGSTDDTVALQAAVTASGVTGKTLYLSGTPLIASTIAVPANATVVGDSIATKLIKKNGMTSAAMTLADNATVRSVGVYANATTSGGGVWIIGNGAAYEDSYVDGNSQTGVGIKVGSNTLGVTINCNSWSLKNVTSARWSSHGIHIHDGDGKVSGPEANAGNAIHCFTTGNGGDGFRVENAMGNTFTGCLGESNTGNGINLGPSGFAGTYRNFNNTINGGDYEANTAGQIVFGGSSHTNSLLGANGTITGVGYGEFRYDYSKVTEAAFTPVIYLGNSPLTADTCVVSGTNLTVHTTTAHGLTAGDYVFMYAGVSEAGFGGFVVNSVNAPAQTFTVTLRAQLNDPWTPIATGAFSGSVFRCCTASSAVGRYQIIGNKCHFDAGIQLTGKVGSGQVVLILPLETASISGLYATTTNMFISGTSGTFSSEGGLLLTINHNGAMNTNVFKRNGVGLTATGLLDTDIGATSLITVSGEYWI